MESIKMTAIDVKRALIYFIERNPKSDMVNVTNHFNRLRPDQLLIPLYDMVDEGTIKRTHNGINYVYEVA